MPLLSNLMERTWPISLHVIWKVSTCVAYGRDFGMRFGSRDLKLSCSVQMTPEVRWGVIWEM